MQKYYEISGNSSQLKQAQEDGFSGIISAIPDTLGINLVSVKGIYIEEQEDGQLTQIRIDFLPKNF